MCPVLSQASWRWAQGVGEKSPIFPEGLEAFSEGFEIFHQRTAVTGGGEWFHTERREMQVGHWNKSLPVRMGMCPEQLEVPKARLDMAWDSRKCPHGKGMEQDDLKGPSQPKPGSDSMICIILEGFSRV